MYRPSNYYFYNLFLLPIFLSIGFTFISVSSLCQSSKRNPTLPDFMRSTYNDSTGLKRICFCFDENYKNLDCLLDTINQIKYCYIIEYKPRFIDELRTITYSTFLDRYNYNEYKKIASYEKINKSIWQYKLYNNDGTYKSAMNLKLTESVSGIDTLFYTNIVKGFYWEEVIEYLKVSEE